MRDRVAKGVEAAGSSGTVLRELVSGLQEAAAVSQDVAAAMRQQAAGTRQAADALERIVAAANDIRDRTSAQDERSRNMGMALLETVERLRNLESAARMQERASPPWLSPSPRYGSRWQEYHCGKSRRRRSPLQIIDFYFDTQVTVCCILRTNEKTYLLWRMKRSSPLPDRTLEQHGFECARRQCEEAMRRGRGHRLILMDINLGAGMDGSEAARRILAARDVRSSLTNHNDEKTSSAPNRSCLRLLAKIRRRRAGSFGPHGLRLSDAKRRMETRKDYRTP
jgi:hypothetical protein